MTKNTLIYALIIGIVLRLVLAVTTYHGDLAALVLAGRSIAGNWETVNFYDSVFTIGEQGELKLPDHKMTFIYQPLAYFIPGIFYLPFGGLINNIWEGLLHTNPYLLEGRFFYFPLLLFKLPLILADLGVVLLLPYLITKEKDKRLAQVLWLFNPLAIYVSSMIGQVDAILTFFLVAGLVTFSQKRFTLSAILFTLSALVKPIGLIVLPILAIYAWYDSKSISISLKTFFTGISIYLIGVIPFLPSVAYRQYTLFAEHIAKTLFAGIAIAPGTLIPWFFIAYAFIIALVLRKKVSGIFAIGAALLTSLCFTHFHPQWFVWITPWLIYYLITTKDWATYLITITAWLIILFSFEYSLTFGMFFGLNLNIPTLPSPISSNLIQLVFLSRSWLIALLLILILQTDNEAKK